MGSDTKIEWARHTFNPWSGCEKVSAGCAHCYAAALPPGMRRHAEWGKDRPRVMASEAYWSQPLAWNRAAEKAGERHRVFCASTADVFEDRHDLDPWRERLWALIAETPHLDWLLLTKRPERMARWATRHPWPVNAWAGTSVEDQATADARIPYLLQVPALVRFLSMEPLLGAVNLCGYIEVDWIARAAGMLRRGRYPLSGAAERRRVDWVIVGGESGRRARPMHPDRARALRDQCQGAGVPFFFKQHGEYIAEPGGVEEGDHAFPAGLHMTRVGKAAAGRLLDGREWNEVPDAR